MKRARRARLGASGAQVRVDAAAFLRDGIARGFFEPADYIAGVEIGNQIVDGRDTTWINRLEVTVE